MCCSMSAFQFFYFANINVAVSAWNSANTKGEELQSLTGKASKSLEAVKSENDLLSYLDEIFYGWLLPALN